MTEYATGLTTTSYACVAYSVQNKILKIKGRFWILVGDDGIEGGGLYLLSTLNFQDFTFNYVGTIGFDKGRGAAMAYNPILDILHICYNSGSTTGYRACTPDADGTVDWIAATEQIIGGAQHNSNIALDSDGYPWIIDYQWVAADNTWNLTVQKSSTNDGTWTTDATITKILHNTAADPTYVSGIPIAQTGGKMYFIYTKPYGNPMFGWQYDPDTGWAAAEDAISTSNATGIGCNFDAVPDGDNIHLAFNRETIALSQAVIYQKFTYGTGWSAETQIELLANGAGGVAIALNARATEIYIHFCYFPAGASPAGALHRWRYKNSAWSELATVATTEGDPNFACNMRGPAGFNIISYQGDTSKLLYIIAYGIQNPALRCVSCGL